MCRVSNSAHARSQAFSMDELDSLSSHIQNQGIHQLYVVPSSWLTGLQSRGEKSTRPAVKLIQQTKVKSKGIFLKILPHFVFIPANSFSSLRQMSRETLISSTNPNPVNDKITLEVQPIIDCNCIKISS